MVRHYYIPRKEDAWELSNLMAKLFSIDPIGEDIFAFTVLESETDSGGVLSLETDIEYPVFMKDDFQFVTERIGAILNGALAQDEGAEMVKYLMSGKITFGGLIPSNLEWQSRTALIQKGFYVKPPFIEE